MRCAATTSLNAQTLRQGRRAKKGAWFDLCILLATAALAFAPPCCLPPSCPNLALSHHQPPAHCAQRACGATANCGEDHNMGAARHRPSPARTLGALSARPRVRVRAHHSHSLPVRAAALSEGSRRRAGSLSSHSALSSFLAQSSGQVRSRKPANQHPCMCCL